MIIRKDKMNTDNEILQLSKDFKLLKAGSSFISKNASEFSSKYPNKFIAVYNDKLVAVNENFDKIMEEISKKKIDKTQVLIQFIPEKNVIILY